MDKLEADKLEANKCNYLAWIMGDGVLCGELVQVDLRLLSTSQLNALRNDAAAHGDESLVATVKAILDLRV